jgi:hypothetical protein
MTTRTLEIKFIGDASGAKKAFAEVDDSSGKLTGKLSGLTSTIAGVAGGFLGAEGIKAGAGFLIDAAKAAAEDEAATQRLEQSLRNAGGAFDENIQKVNERIDAGQKLAYSDDEVRDSFQQLLAATGDTDEALRRQAIAMDLSRGAGISLEQASKMVGKVNEENVEAFKRLGITIGEGASETEALAAVQAKFAGQADTYAKSTAGQMEQAKLRMGELKEQLGTALLPAFTAFANFLVGAVLPAVERFANESGPKIQEFAQKVRQYWESDIKPALDAMVAAWQKLQPVIKPILEQVANVVEHTVRTIALALGIVIDLLGGDFSGAWKKAKELVAEQIRYIKETVENLGALIRGAIPLIAEAAKAVGSAIFDAIWEGLGDLWQVGADIINWMLQGLKAMAWQIEQWVTNFAKGIIDKLDPRKWDIPGLSPFIQAYGHAGQLAGSAMMSGMASQVTAEAGKVTSALSAAATLDPRGDDPKALADAIWDWHNDPMFGFVTPAAPGITWGSNGKNVAPLSQSAQVIQLVVDGQVLAETVAQHQARAY